MRGDMVEARYLRNQVNRATAKQNLISAMHALKQCINRETNNWWKNIYTKKIDGSKNNRQIKRTEPCK